MRTVATIIALTAFQVVAHAQTSRALERLDRGVVAVRGEAGAVVIWRLLGNEPAGAAFNVYRVTGNGEPQRLNDQPLAGPTMFVDAKPAADAATYSVRAIVDGNEQPAAGAFTTAVEGVQPYLTIPLNTPAGYTPGDASTADLDGDGRYDLVVKFEGRAKDNSQSGVTDPVLLRAYTLDGKQLWEINLGPNIRAGAHYTQFQVFDYDGDGKAELVCKTADGTTDGAGKVIGDAKANYVNEGGYILRGPEFLTVFDGLTGAALDTVPYAPSRALSDDPTPSADAMKAIWGDGYGNRGDRFLACTAFLGGEHASVVMCRGYYTRTFLAAYDFKGGKLVNRWLFDSEDPKCVEGRETITAPSTRPSRGRGERHAFSGQGYHSLSVADVDGDGKDEIIYGSMTVDDDGRGLYTTGWGHGDALHVGDLDPANPGLEVFGIQERFDDAGMHMHDARTGKPLWKRPSVKAAEAGGDKGEGPGRGISADVDPRYPGAESWALGAGMLGMVDARGNKISDKLPTVHLGGGQGTYGVDAAPTRGRDVPTCNFRIYWDGDALDELLDKNQIMKWNWTQQTTTRLLVADGCESNNGTKSTPILSADILGDWREELILRTADNSALRIYTTTIPTDIRHATLMHDAQYRMSIAWQNTAYNQPPHVGFDFNRATPAMAPKDVR